VRDSKGASAKITNLKRTTPRCSMPSSCNCAFHPAVVAVNDAANSKHPLQSSSQNMSCPSMEIVCLQVACLAGTEHTLVAGQGHEKKEHVINECHKSHRCLGFQVGGRGWPPNENCYRNYNEACQLGQHSWTSLGLAHEAAAAAALPVCDAAAAAEAVRLARIAPRHLGPRRALLRRRAGGSH